MQGEQCSDVLASKSGNLEINGVHVMKTENGKNTYHELKKTIAVLIVLMMMIAIVFLNVFTHVVSIARYYGSGMEPSLSNGQRLVVLHTERVKTGDMIAFYYNNQLIVRRVICEGEHQIVIADNGEVSIDGDILEEPYVENLSLGQCNINFPYYVVPGHYFVMGDNRSVAIDSRLKEIGTVSSDRILGKVILAI